MTKIQIIKSRGQWYWRIVASNGRILAYSEKYTRRAAAYKTIAHFLKSIDSRIVVEENLEVVYSGFFSEVLFHLKTKSNPRREK